uniref:C2H2-type domain-containing protein n=1 Tax=Polytomella parva TaxID=51329 RepID=A0A7S0YHV6_9CHLO|mmetsp:Transcript_27637/g.51024  ORF Transcript_27637/g.51024 Transcript_27637/m.51024 type:complete len:325 (+) Transcript_27637:60-1034(+)
MWFYCDLCGDSIKKPKLVNHYRQCSSHYFTCIDCCQKFDRTTVQGHSVCVTEFQKYALGATKPGGFAANGYEGKAPVQSVTASEPTGLQFLATRPPWKCSICNVNCTSRDTLISHATGLKHKRRVKAATGENYKDTDETAQKPSEQPAKKARIEAPSSSSSSSSSDSSDDEKKAVAAPKKKRSWMSESSSSSSDSSEDEEKEKKSKSETKKVEKKSKETEGKEASSSSSSSSSEESSAGSSSSSSSSSSESSEDENITKSESKPTPSHDSSSDSSSSSSSSIEDAASEGEKSSPLTSLEGASSKSSSSPSTVTSGIRNLYRSNY